MEIDSETNLDLVFESTEKEYQEDYVPKTDKPYNPDLVDVVSLTIPIHSLLDRIEHDEIDLSPEFQRSHDLWDKTKESRLIESILIKLPLPVFYLDSRNEDKWAIVDGLQRINTLNNFVLRKVDDNRKLFLTNLEYLTEFEGCSYEQLPRNMQRRLQESQILAYCIRKGTPEDVTISIFKRINTGGLTLTSAEIRNCVFHGLSANLIKTMAESEIFKKVTRYKISPARMDDRDLVTRFCAFYLLGYENYKGNMDSFLELGMKYLKDNYTEENKHTLLEKFNRTMFCCLEIFGDYAFRKMNIEKRMYGPLNKSLFECVSSCIGLLTTKEQEFLISEKERFGEKFKELFYAEEFYNAISSATGIIEHVNARHFLLTNFLRSFIRNSIC